MGFFNLIESLFLLSLGITFILILLLVWHFKTRLGSIEQKNETMFDIVNNIVKEINVLRVGEIGQLKQIIQATLYQQNAFAPPAELYHQTSSKLSDAILTNIGLPPIQEEQTRVLTDDSDSEEVSEYDEDDEYNSETEQNDDASSDESGSESDKKDDDSEEENPNELVEEESNEVSTIETQDAADQIKVVHLPSIDYENIEEIQDLVEEVTDEFGQETQPEIEELGDITELINVSEEEQIIVSKLDESNNVSEKEPETAKESVKETYKKLTIQQLKALVISRGIATDVAKLKKADLVKLLETTEI